MVDRGVIHGRFQVFHNDHLRYVLAGKSRCRHLIVGITNPDPLLTRDDPADPNRSSPLANPLTYFERYTMVRKVLLGASLEHAEFSIVPFPINLPALYRYYLPLDATLYLTVYDEWGKRKLDQFRAVGLKTEVLWTKDRNAKGLSAGEIRERMALGQAWEHLVPPETEILMKKWGIPARLKGLYETDAAGSCSCN
jgi:nicotinamide mononucleotide adenylyltransferase